jgi:hypothetical protein
MVKSKEEYRDSPVAWFCVLEQARLANDFEKAVEAKRQLERLGIVVKYKRSYKKLQAIIEETDGR